MESQNSFEMLFKIIIFLQILILAAGQSPKCSDAEVFSLRKCWTGYLANLGFSGIPSYADYQKKYVAYLNSQGPRGFNQVCQWVSTKSTCEAAYLSDCHNNAGYQKVFNTTDPVEAGNYFTTEAMNQWECTTGYNMTLDSFYCKLSIHNNHEAELQKCEDTVISEFNHGFNCSYAVEYVNCVTKIYLRYCGGNAGKWGCNIAEVAMKNDVPMCVDVLPACGTIKFEQPNLLLPFYHPKKLIQ